MCLLLLVTVFVVVDSVVVVVVVTVYAVVTVFVVVSAAVVFVVVVVVVFVITNCVFAFAPVVTVGFGARSVMAEEAKANFTVCFVKNETVEDFTVFLSVRDGTAVNQTGKYVMPQWNKHIERLRKCFQY